MTARSFARVASLIAGVAVVAVLALPGGAHANEVPPTTTTTTIPAPPVNGQGNIKACELAYQQVRAEALAEFRAKILAAINDSDLVAIGDAVDELIDGLVGLNQAFYDCLVRVTPGPLRAGLDAKPRHHGGGGGSSCLGTYDKAVKKATRTEDRSFRKKHHTVTPQVAAATFNTAVTNAAHQLQSCLGA